MTTIKRVIPGAALAAALLAGACSESSTSPSTTDPTAMATAVTSMSSSLMQNSAFLGLSAVIHTSGFTGAAAVASTAPVILPRVSWPAAAVRAEGAMRVLASNRPSALEALFPANVLGKTFQWDNTVSGYRITDSTVTGAPSNGVRFLLYQVDTSTGMPTVPLVTTGNVDLADQSTASANVLHIVIHVGNQSAADYTITETTTTSNLTLSASGYVQNVVSGGTPVTFTLTHVFTPGATDTTLYTTFNMSGNGATVAMVTTVTSSASGSSETFDWTFTKNGSVELVGTGTDTTFDAQVKLNGSVFARISGTPSAPVITDANGHALTATQLLALEQIVIGFYSLYGGANIVFIPGILLFG